MGLWEAGRSSVIHSRPLFTCLAIAGPRRPWKAHLGQCFKPHCGDKHQAWAPLLKPCCQAANAVGLALLRQSVGREHGIKHLSVPHSLSHGDTLPYSDSLMPVVPGLHQGHSGCPLMTF